MRLKGCVWGSPRGRGLRPRSGPRIQAFRWAENHGHADIAAYYKDRLASAERIVTQTPTTPEEQKAWTEALDRLYPYPGDMEERVRDAKALGMDVEGVTSD